MLFVEAVHRGDTIVSTPSRASHTDVTMFRVMESPICGIARSNTVQAHTITDYDGRAWFGGLR